MKSVFPFALRERRQRLVFVVGIIVAGVISPVAWAQSQAPWVVLYQDNFHYTPGQPDTTFNTWFWREDSTGTHAFNVTQGDGCTVTTPCVKLTAKASLGNTAYTNAEMYNNACVQQVPNADASQQLATLAQSAWGMALEQRIKRYCKQPYPYRPARDPSASAGVETSWADSALPAYLEANPWALTAYDQEASWEAVRDIVFNNPYQATPHQAVRITMRIKAQTRNQGGSRGWGFWNTSMDPSMMQLAWFMEYSTPSTTHTSGKHVVWMQTVAPLAGGGVEYCATRLPKTISIYAWHTYRIQWSANDVSYYVDDQLEARHPIHLTRHMAFHNWVDNRNYGYPFNGGPPNYPLTQDKSNDIRSFTVETQAQGRHPSPVAGAPMVAAAACQSISAKQIKAPGNPLTYIVIHDLMTTASRQGAAKP